MATGIRKVVLCTGHMAEALKPKLGSRFRDLNLRCSCDSRPLETDGALRVALEQLPGRTVLVMNGNFYRGTNLAAFMRFHQQCRASNTLWVARVPRASSYGRVKANNSPQATAFTEKYRGDGSGWINAGIFLLQRDVIGQMPSGNIVSLKREAFPQWIGRGLCACQGGGRFLDIGTPRSYAEAEQFSTAEAAA